MLLMSCGEVELRNRASHLLKAKQVSIGNHVPKPTAEQTLRRISPIFERLLYIEKGARSSHIVSRRARR